MAESGEARSGMAPLTGLVPMIFASDVQRSIEFYQLLGFRLMKTVKDEEKGFLTWAWVQNGKANLMLARTGRPLNPDAQDFLFYVYTPDVAAYRAELMSRGLKPGEIKFPSYSPRGEFRIDDPDGFALFVAHAD